VSDADPFDLDGRVAIVTGASRGVGAATAVALAAEGCRVACAARSTREAPQRTKGTLDETLERIEAAGGTGLALPTNLADDEDTARMVRATVERFGRLDVLVNNAAVTFVGDVEIPMRRHSLVMAINLQAPFVACREAIPYLRVQGGGRIVNVSSLAALVPFPGLMTYGMSKVALERMTVDLAGQLAPDNIAVNCFRIDVPVASEGFLANAPDFDHSDWEPSEVAAEGIVWLIRRPARYSGRLESMYHLREREGIMASRASRPYAGPPPVDRFEGGH
jgi:NAD(P)-dependent dehydrogenase (short-subunit alcohol dehydrogenase family)